MMDSNKESICQCETTVIRSLFITVTIAEIRNLFITVTIAEIRNLFITVTIAEIRNLFITVTIAEIRNLLVSVTIAVMYCFHQESYTVDYKFSEEVQTDNHDFHDQI